MSWNLATLKGARYTAAISSGIFNLFTQVRAATRHGIIA
jgi:hypothetical protein